MREELAAAEAANARAAASALDMDAMRVQLERADAHAARDAERAAALERTVAELRQALEHAALGGGLSPGKGRGGADRWCVRLACKQAAATSTAMATNCDRNCTCAGGLGAFLCTPRKRSGHAAGAVRQS